MFGLVVELVGFVWLLVMIGGAEPGKEAFRSKKRFIHKLP